MMHSITVAGQTFEVPSRDALRALARMARRDPVTRDESMRAYSAGVDFFITASGELKPEARWDSPPCLADAI